MTDLRLCMVCDTVPCRAIFRITFFHLIMIPFLHSTPSTYLVAFGGEGVDEFATGTLRGSRSTLRTGSATYHTCTHACPDLRKGKES